MTQLLVSVRNQFEAQAATAGGAELIDIKEPANGPLGKADWSVVQEVCAAVGGQRPISIACGELVDFSLERLDSFFQLPPAVRWLKLGLSGCHSTAVWNGEIAKVVAIAEMLPHNCGVILATYADWEAAAAPPTDKLLHRLVEHSAASLAAVGLLMDTFEKQNGRLFDALGISQISDFVNHCKKHGRTVALAGSLQQSDIAQLLPLAPNYLGFRTAACEAGRESAISMTKVANLYEQISSANLNIPPLKKV